MVEQGQDFNLSQENLIPFYIIQDRIKENFKKIERTVKKQWQTNHTINDQLAKLNQYNDQYRQDVGLRFLELEKKIVTQINSELEGRIIVAINKNMGAFTSRMEEKQKEIEKVNEGINDKLEAIKKTIVYDVSKQNQKFFAKESQKLEKKIKGNVEDMVKKAPQGKPAGGAALRPASREKEHPQGRNIAKTYHYEGLPHSPQTYFNEEWVLKIKEMQAKMNRFQEFSINFDKRFYENMTSLKESWKELGEDMLDTKRKLTSKHDELKLQLIKLRTMREFQGSPKDYEETFKTKLMQKFTEIYQTISQLCSKPDLEGSIDKIKKTLNRHDNQLSDVREEMAKNSDYFTFYMNNSDNEDLSSKLKEVNEKIEDKQKGYNDRFKKQIEKNEILQVELAKMNEVVEQLTLKNTKLQKDYKEMRQEHFKELERLEVLEDHNSFSPQKMAKIHNTLDIDFTPSQQELLAKKTHTNTQNTVIKELKGEINKFKDELFVLNHQLAEVEKLKKGMTGIESKLDKMKIQSEEAILSRKPWVCLSCDKEKQEADRVKREMSKKKLAENRGGLFTKDKSQKLIKLIPSPQEKFQVYEKYREKYLSDAVRLPDIYKQKIGDKEP